MRRSLLWLVAGALTGGCSRDAPITGPDAGPPDGAVAAAAVAAELPNPAALAGTTGANGPSAAAIDDALTRLVPALGEWGSPLGEALARMQTRRNDRHARIEVQRLIEAIAHTLPQAYHPDLDALRLQLEITTH